MAWVVQGNLAAAQLSLDEAEPITRMLGDEAVLHMARAAHMLIKVVSGDEDAAREAGDVLLLARQFGDNWFEVRLLEMQAQCALRQGNAAQAASQLEEGVRIARAAGDVWGLAQVLGNLGDVARSRDLSDEAQHFTRRANHCADRSESLNAPRARGRISVTYP